MTMWILRLDGWFMVFNAFFNNISVISFDSKRSHTLTKMNNNIMGLEKGVLLSNRLALLYCWHLTNKLISRSFSHLQDLAYLWNVIVYAKKCKVRTVPADLLYNVLAKSLANSDQYYQYLEMWVKLCESNLLQQMNKEVTLKIIYYYYNLTSTRRKIFLLFLWSFIHNLYTLDHLFWLSVHDS